ncbi:hypothetical protein EPUS_00345 [Endocarpon pusillum Z07020]|uniref:Uncharacterized protein n=1 Tax=Endocarpon pusillum (strain Z07020 / HMAS-L-300199) TaxID=1263415 RepID=U1GDM4_ENDPU|nr:uncharacterized protein EPUS_00345 [Endocarpon pusillum Z07020]ERF70158.1 hypothetical protein EPUS_00345 [Endocarpon pusillum Z07020]
MFSIPGFGLILLASIVRAQVDNGCGTISPASTIMSPTTISSCTLFFTPSMPAQEGPTSTVWATMMTTQFNVVNCNYCQISNVANNPMPTGPFTTKITSDYLLITQIACIPNTSGFTRRHALPVATPEPTALYIRGAKPQTLTPMVKKSVPIPKLAERLRRQASPQATGDALILTGEASRLIEQLFTVIYSIGVINSATDLRQTCLQLQSANAVLDLDRVRLNATQAASIVCAASLPGADLVSFNQTLIAKAAEGIFSVQIAANFTGTVETNRLCDQLDLRFLPGLGVDANAVKSFVCNANNGTFTTTGTDNATSTTTLATNNSTLTGSDVLCAPTIAPSAGTTIPFPFSNFTAGALTMAGTITVTGPAGTAVTAPWGTGFPASGRGLFSTGNLTTATGCIGFDTLVTATGDLPAGTGNVENSTTADVTRNLLTPIGTAETGCTFNGTGNLAAGTITVAPVTGVSVTGDASAGYAMSTVDPESSLAGYGQEPSERLPRGPNSTPRYYPKYF